MDEPRAQEKLPDPKKQKSTTNAIMEMDTIGMVDEEPVILAAIEDLNAQWMHYMPEDERRQLRLTEISKLEMFNCFQPKHRREVPKGTRIYRHTWVDTDAKSRLTVKDLRRFGTEEQITCPTPTHMSNALFDYLVVYFNLEMYSFDVVSAFPHAEEQNEKVFMWPPTEWLEREDVIEWMAKHNIPREELL